ncbi:MAG: antibiotic biosynthesis monooxygenase [Acidobacteria bacterium]|nr:antibiotic biosynthesis monooxygenase [Acidobacteriota bacterium]
MIARTPDLPYVAVIFTNLLRADALDYEVVAERMLTLARLQPGFLGVESVRDERGLGLTVSYWKDEAAALAWKAVAEHREAQRLGRERFYATYALRVARVERQAFFGGV